MHILHIYIYIVQSMYMHIYCNIKYSAFQCHLCWRVFTLSSADQFFFFGGEGGYFALFSSLHPTV